VRSCAHGMLPAYRGIHSAESYAARARQDRRSKSAEQVCGAGRLRHPAVRFDREGDGGRLPRCHSRNGLNPPVRVRPVHSRAYLGGSRDHPQLIHPSLGQVRKVMCCEHESARRAPERPSSRAGRICLPRQVNPDEVRRGWNCLCGLVAVVISARATSPLPSCARDWSNRFAAV